MSRNNSEPNTYQNNEEAVKDSSQPIFDSASSLPQLRHWNEVVFEYLGVHIDERSLAGGSDYGQLPYIIDSGDILLEVNGQKVAGLTRNDVIDLIKSKPLVDVKVVSSSSSFGLPIDLREYLSRRFVRNTVDHDLQATIRDNVYMRTIPCTTRPPKEGEINGVDYKFVSRKVFAEMERSGVLLESGVYAGHHYGTPLPLSAPTSSMSYPINYDTNDMQQENSSYASHSQTANTASTGSNFVNTAASNLASKRKRNRSNIAAIDASSLPHGWEKISDAHYGVYYIDHINKRTQYERPYEIELTKGNNGFGFTLVELDKGLVVVKNIVPGGPAYLSGVIQPGDVLVSVSGISVSGLQHSDIAKLFSTFSIGDRVKLTFARGYQLPFDIQNDDQEFEYLTLSLSKGMNGFGFTISDGNLGQKVKKILDVERCNLLRQGDILINVNNIDLTCLQHMQVVEVLKQCAIDEVANIMVKRRKRFRSKTPTTLQSGSLVEKENNIPQRNCKTPNCELMMRKDIDWMNEGNVYVNTMEVTNNGQQMVNSQDTYDSEMIHNSASNDQMKSNTYLNGHNNPTYLLKQEAMDPRMLSLLPSNSNTCRKEINVNPGLISTLNNNITDQALERNRDEVNNEEEYEYYVVSLTRKDSGFGFRIVGGAEDGRNVAIGSIVIGGIAHQDGILKAGDEIISINDRNVIGASHHHVVDLMSECDQTVSLLVRRKKDSDAFDVVLNREPNEGFGFVIISCGNCALIGRIINGSPAQRCQRLRIRDKIIAVNGQDTSTMSHPDIVNMIKESGSSLCLRIIPTDCYAVELIRGPKGFGFSIRGGAEFNGMPLFILRIAPDGPAHSLLNIGDEIIEINGIFTVGMTHADAVQIISQSGPQVKLKLRRNANSSVTEMNTNIDTTGVNHLGLYGYNSYSSYSAPNLMQSQIRSTASFYNNSFQQPRQHYIA